MKILKGWRNSASVVIVAKNVFGHHKPSEFNYEMLTLKRSAKSKFMPGTHVYPGGTSSKSDSSPSWFDLYASFGIKKEGLNNVENFPEKLTAIRETFEETGILICRSFKERYDSLVTSWASYIGGYEVQKWQNRVHDDENEFLNLCKEMEVYPDVWCLKPWANWMTPPLFKQRFNTLFFLAAFNEKPAVQVEESEVQSIEWNSPLDLLLSDKAANIILPPPQFYETSRLLNFKKIEDLAEYANKKPSKLLSMFPYMISTDEARYSIYPGDDLYPNEINIENTDINHYEKLPDSNVKHRTLTGSPYNKIIIENFQPPEGHILPLDYSNSKL